MFLSFVVHVHTIYMYMYIADAVTIVLFQVLGAFANRPLDPSIESNEVAITAADVRKLHPQYKAIALSMYMYVQFRF